MGDEVIVSLRAAANAPIERILLRTCPDGEQFFAEMRIEESQSSTACTWWSAKLRRTSPALIDGGFQVLLAEENILAYILRELFTGKISTVINGNLPLPCPQACKSGEQFLDVGIFIPSAGYNELHVKHASSVEK